MENKDIAIKIQGLSKRYAVGKQKDGSLRGTINNIFKSSKKTGDYFWALSDVNFEINKGDVVGIVGKNGAGKSTLLKILSQITKPTKGRIEINGRVASLLEVGTGFHPELTGRENIFLNGTILGMSRKEVKEKFDEIVEFSGVQKFIDTPVKHYSSGMYVRLAFAVAAHLEPEILIIDEVLAVGDAEFQKKCLGKMKDVANQGRTVIFVSHNMNAVNTLCNKAIYLSKGTILSEGKTTEVIDEYLTNDLEVGTSKVWKEDFPGDEIASLKGYRLVNKNLENIDYAEIEQKVGVEYQFEIHQSGKMPIPNIHLKTIKGDTAFISAEKQSDEFFSEGSYKAIAWIPGNLLNDGVYTVDIGLTSMAPYQMHFIIKNAISFNVVENIEKRKAGHNQKIHGILRPLLEWEISKHTQN